MSWVMVIEMGSLGYEHDIKSVNDLLLQVGTWEVFYLANTLMP